MSRRRALAPVTTPVAALIALLLAATPAFAHRLLAEAWVEAGEVVVEAFFADGTPAAGAEVTARVVPRVVPTGGDGRVVWRGTTDPRGAARFHPPQGGRYQVEVVDAALHRAVLEVLVAAPQAAAALDSATVASSDSSSVAVAAGGAPPGANAPAPPSARPPARAHAPGVPWGRLALGLLIIAALASLLPGSGRLESSWLGRADDRARLAALLLLAAGMAAVETPQVTVGCAALALALALSVGLDARRLARRLWPVGAVLAPLVLVTPFYWPDDVAWRPLVAGWSWSPTDVGLQRTGALAARVLAMAIAVTVALVVAPFDRTIRALQQLRVPEAITQTLLLTYRYLFVVRRDLQGARVALAARGFSARTDLATVRTLAGVTGGLLVRSVARTERVEQAMRCRGYRGRLLVPARRAGSGRDLLLVAAAALTAALLVALDRGAFA